MRSTVRPARIADYPMFLSAALAISAVVAVGFAPTWFLRAWHPTTVPLTTLVVAHGTCMTAWFVLFAVQSALVAAGRTDLHRRLGRLGSVVLVLVVVTTVPTMVAAARLGGDHLPGPPVPALAFVAGFLIAFAALAGAGLQYRRRPDYHKRLMLLASVTAMEAAVTRLPLEFLDSPLTFHAATDGLLLLIIAIDTVRHRRLHPAFLWGGAFFLGTQAGVIWVAGTSGWAGIARWIIGSA